MPSELLIASPTCPAALAFRCCSASSQPRYSCPYWYAFHSDIEAGRRNSLRGGAHRHLLLSTLPHDTERRERPCIPREGCPTPLLRTVLGRILAARVLGPHTTTCPTLDCPSSPSHSLTFDLIPEVFSLRSRRAVEGANDAG